MGEFAVNYGGFFIKEDHPMVNPVPKVTQYYRKRFSVNLHGQPYEQTYRAFLRNGYVQKPPYVDTSVRTDIGEALDGFSDASSWNVEADASDAATQATNNARAKFVSKLGDASSFGATLTAELKSTWGTVVSSIVTALTAARQVSRGDLIAASHTLGFRPPVVRERVTTRRRRRRGGKYSKTYQIREYWVMPDGRRVLKNLGNRWLWYSYGVKPLVQDIYNGMDVLTREHPRGTKVSGHGSGTYRYGNPYDWYKNQYTWQSSVRITAYVSVNNPNLWLANQLGLINPVQMFNEGIRLSFVVDWFSNLSQIINQMTDFVGLDIARPVTSSKHVVNHTAFHPDYNVVFVKRRTLFTRVLAIPNAKLRFAYERFEWQRGANAISLLLGVLGNNSLGKR